MSMSKLYTTASARFWEFDTGVLNTTVFSNLVGIDVDTLRRRAIALHSRDNPILKGVEANADGHFEMLTKQGVH